MRQLIAKLFIKELIVVLKIDITIKVSFTGQTALVISFTDQSAHHMLTGRLGRGVP